MTKAANLAALSSGPAFSAYRNTSNQSISSSTWTKVQAQTEEFDTASAYDNTTNYRFQPQVAGYYQVTGNMDLSGSTSYTAARLGLQKNGVAVKYGTTTSLPDTGVTALVYLNGTTDYVELYAFIVASVASISFGAEYTYFQAALVRAA